MSLGKILVVDDEDTLLDIFQEFIENCGYKAIVCNNLDKAINEYKTNYKDLKLVFLDNTLSTYDDGLNIARQIREYENLNKISTIPIISISASPDIILKYLNKGIQIQGHIMKNKIFSNIEDIIENEVKMN